MNPKLVIITASLNSTIEQFSYIQGLLEQAHTQGIYIEWVIQDKGSSFACVEYLKSLPYVNIQQSDDTGIYDAWNKALARTTGTHVTFLGLDDYPYLEWLLYVVDRIDSGYNICACDVRIENIGMTSGGVFSNVRSGKIDTKSNDFSHPGLVFPIQLYEGKLFDDYYKIIGDLVFYSKLSLDVDCHFGGEGVKMTLGGVSNTKKGQRLILAEYIHAVRNGHVEYSWKFFIKKVIRSAISLTPLYYRAQDAYWKTREAR